MNDLASKIVKYIKARPIRFVALAAAILFWPGLASYWDRGWLSGYLHYDESGLLRSFPVEVEISAVVRDKPLTIKRQFACEDAFGEPLGSGRGGFQMNGLLRIAERVNDNEFFVAAIGADCHVLDEAVEVGQKIDDTSESVYFAQFKGRRPEKIHVIAAAVFGITSNLKRPEFQIYLRGYGTTHEPADSFDRSTIHLSITKLSAPARAFFPIRRPVREYGKDGF